MAVTGFYKPFGSVQREGRTDEHNGRTDGRIETDRQTDDGQTDGWTETDTTDRRTDG